MSSYDNIQYFKSEEFDSPDLPGSGKRMKNEFLQKLDRARRYYNKPMHINSGYRTLSHNEKVGGVSNSAHTRGWAADVKCYSNRERIYLVKALILAGFSRIGVGNKFIHVDCDPTKNSSMWTY